MAIEKWAILHKIPLNSSKTLHLSIGNNRARYFLREVCIPSVEKAIDMGIIYDDKFSFKHQETAIILKSKKMIGGGKKCCRTYHNKYLLMRLFKSYYLPKIEYGALIWRNSSIGQKNKLESILRSATRAVFKNPHTSFEDRLKLFGINNLDLRLEKSTILTAVKMIKKNSGSFIKDYLRKTTFPTVFFNHKQRKNVINDKQICKGHECRHSTHQFKGRFTSINSAKAHSSL